VTAYYLLVASDSQTASGGVLSSYRVALRRLKLRKWSLYRRTPNRTRLRDGDLVLIYAAGSKAGGGTFVASATVSHIGSPPRWSTGQDADIPSDIPVGILELAEIRLFENPPEIQLLRGELSFIPKHNKWGAVLQGGCKGIDKSDYETIIRWANRTDEQANKSASN